MALNTPGLTGEPLRRAEGSFGRRQRALLQVLREANTELSGQELHQQLRAQSPNYGLATVYRSLKQLQSAGLIRWRKLPNGESVYAPLERDGHHLICVRCGRSELLPMCPVAAGARGEASELLQGFQPLFHTFEIHGFCGDCQGTASLSHG